jgi:hypothetical protein
MSVRLEGAPFAGPAGFGASSLASVSSFLFNKSSACTSGLAASGFERLLLCIGDTCEGKQIKSRLSTIDLKCVILIIIIFSINLELTRALKQNCIY